MNVTPPFVIFSVSRTEYADELTADRTEFAARQLQARNIAYIRIDGVFSGITTRAFLVFTHERTYEAQEIESLAARYGQKNILYVDAAGLAYTRPMDGGPDEEIGRFKEVSSYDASRREGYLYVNGKYY